MLKLKHLAMLCWLAIYAASSGGQLLNLLCKPSARLCLHFQGKITLNAFEFLFSELYSSSHAAVYQVTPSLQYYHELTQPPLHPWPLIRIVEKISNLQVLLISRWNCQTALCRGVHAD